MIPVTPPEGIPISILPLSASYANTLTVCAEPPILIVVVVPGTNDPVSVFTVRDNQYNDGCDSVNEEWFGNFYGAGGLPPLISPNQFYWSYRGINCTS